MCRSPRGKSSRANNCQQARIVKNLNNQEYRRTAGSVMGDSHQNIFKIMSLRLQVEDPQSHHHHHRRRYRQWI